MGASAVLRAIAEDPPPSLRKKFDKIIHIDCSRWKSRRVLQRAIAAELKLSPDVMAAFDRQDEEDDYSGVPEGSRAEIEDVTREIYQTISNLSCLVILHNGSDSIVDIEDFGFPRYYRFSAKSNKLLWTFRGRGIVNRPDMRFGSSFIIYAVPHVAGSWPSLRGELLLEEAREVVKHVQHKQRVTPGTAARCFSYLLSLDIKERIFLDMERSDIHASNYWVCDGIIEEGQFDESWEVSAALQQKIQIEELLWYGRREQQKTQIEEILLYGTFADKDTSLFANENTQHWKSVTYSPRRREKAEMNVDTELTSLFLASTGTYPLDMFQLPSDMFQKSERLSVLKLYHCKFSFFSPPFHCCRCLRFLGLDSCEDDGTTPEEERKQGSQPLEFLGHLWVLDISHTDWDLELPQNIMEQMATNIRDVRIENERIWHNNFAWRRLQNLRRLRVINPTRSWETGNKDEFTDMAKLELLDLSRNSTIQVLPSLCTATGLKTLVLDGCVELDHVGPEGLPPSLESFSLDAMSDKLSKISLEGCVHLESFLLRGSLPGLEVLSGTSVKKVDLSGVIVLGLQIFLVGCKQLRAILWGEYNRPKVLCIDTHERAKVRGQSLSDSSSLCIQNITYDSYVIATDARIAQSLPRPKLYGLTTNSLYLDLSVTPPSSSRSKGSSIDKIILKPCCYRDVLLEGVAAYDDEVTWPVPFDRHIEIGEGIKVAGMTSKAIEAFSYKVAGYFKSLHIHDNSDIIGLPCGTLRHFELKWCRVERCPMLQVLFVPYQIKTRYYFETLQTFWASDLPAAACIWSKGTIDHASDNFKALQSIHLHNCLRVKFVLPFSGFTLPSLETLHISHCGDLRQVFPWDLGVPKEDRAEGTVKEFPKLKHIHLHELTSLQDICEAKMSAPMLERVRLRGCGGLRRLPALGSQNSHRRPVVDCEKDWWEKLKWDGLHVGHHPTTRSASSEAQFSSELNQPTRFDGARVVTYMLLLDFH